MTRGALGLQALAESRAGDDDVGIWEGRAHDRHRLRRAARTLPAIRRRSRAPCAPPPRRDRHRRRQGRAARRRAGEQMRIRRLGPVEVIVEEDAARGAAAGLGQRDERQLARQIADRRGRDEVESRTAASHSCATSPHGHSDSGGARSPRPAPATRTRVPRRLQRSARPSPAAQMPRPAAGSARRVPRRCARRRRSERRSGRGRESGARRAPGAALPRDTGPAGMPRLAYAA